jgi:hypothetical protein
LPNQEVSSREKWRDKREIYGCVFKGVKFRCLGILAAKFIRARHKIQHRPRNNKDEENDEERNESDEQCHNGAKVLLEERCKLLSGYEMKRAGRVKLIQIEIGSKGEAI